MSSSWSFSPLELRRDQLELLAASLQWRKDRLDGHCVDTMVSVHSSLFKTLLSRAVTFSFSFEQISIGQRTT